MAKIIKLCPSCDETFPAKMEFCEKCGAPLQSFEMNPLGKASPEPPVQAPAPKPVAAQSAPEPPPVAPPTIGQTVGEVVPRVSFSEASGSAVRNEGIPAPTPQVPVTASAAVEQDLFEPEQETISIGRETVETAEDRKIQVRAATASATAHGSSENDSWDADDFVSADDSSFRVTIVKEVNVEARNRLLVGALAVMVMLSVGTFVYSMFNLEFDIDSIDSGMDVAVLSEVEPPQSEEEKEERKKKDDKEGGGGGGGGKEQNRPASAGAESSQRPDANTDPTPSFQADFELQTPVSLTKGPEFNSKQQGPLGIKGEITDDLSSGDGSGGGIGSGRGRGIGSGIGDGEGGGIGSGKGNGIGNGYGDGEGDGDGEPPALKVGPTKPLRIVFKPQPGYTEEARKQNINGRIKVRVTFMADGRIGSVTPLNTLGGGLTERAIAAARGIRFEPELKNGVPQSVTKIIDYGFTLY